MNGITPALRSIAVTEKSRKRPTYTTEFRTEAVAKCLDIGIKRTSEDLGVSAATLRTWVSKGEQSTSTESKLSYEELERENQKLKREIGYVNEINRILKKSTAIFSSVEMGGLR